MFARGLVSLLGQHIKFIRAEGLEHYSLIVLLSRRGRGCLWSLSSSPPAKDDIW